MTTRTRLTASQTDRLRRWTPPHSSEAGEPETEADRVIDAMLDRMVGRKSVALDVDEAQVLAIHVDLWRDELESADARLLATLERISGWDD